MILKIRVIGDCIHDVPVWVLKHLLKANLAHIIIEARVVIGDCIHNVPPRVLKHLLKANLAHIIIEARVFARDMKTYILMRME